VQERGVGVDTPGLHVAPVEPEPDRFRSTRHRRPMVARSCPAAPSGYPRARMAAPDSASRAKEIARRLALPVAIWAISAAVYVAVAGPRTSGPTADNHFVHLADSFLHGELGVLGNRPPGTNDWACYDRETQDICPPG